MSDGEMEMQMEMKPQHRSIADGATAWDRQVADYPSPDDIASRAHAHFVRGGRQITRIPEYWRAAEAELLDEAARRVLQPHPRRRTP
jgi:hypothetical protein